MPVYPVDLLHKLISENISENVSENGLLLMNDIYQGDRLPE